MKYACIVIGSGIAGCLVAYRLQKQLPRGSILLIDQATRLGGRILTVDDGMGGHMEFGAMRLSEHHIEAISLCNELDICLEPFHGTFKKGGILYINGKVSRIDHQIPTAEDLLNHRLFEYINKHPLNTKSGKKTPISLLDCLEKDFGCSYYELTFSKVIQHILSPIQFSYYKRSCGYDYLFKHDVSFHGVASSNRGLQAGCNYYKPKDGMYTLVEQLCKKFAHHGGILNLNHKALSVRSENQHYIVDTDQCSYLTQTVIFAIPPHLLTKIDGIISYSGSIYKQLSNALGHYSSLKTHAYFEKAWWSSLINSHPSTCTAFRTDLPLRQGIYPNNTSSAGQVMLIEYRNILDKGDRMIPLQAEYYAHYLELIHGFKVPPPNRLWSHNWLDSSSGLAAHYLKVGKKYSDLQVSYNNQIKDIYFVGEAFSTQHGWISGAIESVNRLLIENPILETLRLSSRD